MVDVSNQEKFRLSGRIRYRAVEDEGVMVHLENGRVLVVNEVGLHIVRALDKQTMTPADLADDVSRVFDVDAETAGVDVMAFLDQLCGEAAVETVDDANSGPKED